MWLCFCHAGHHDSHTRGKFLAMPRGRHRHSPPLHRLLPPSAIAGVSAVCAVGPWLFSEPWVLRGLAAGAAATAVLGAVVMRRWDAAAGKSVADLTRARASDEWRHEERVAELEADLDESRELRTKLEHRLRAKRAELQGLRNEHAALLRRYATAETERATALEGRRLLAIEATTPVRAALPAAASGAPTGEETVAGATSRTAVPEATAATVQAALAASAAASVLYVKANAALDRLAGAGKTGRSAETVSATGDDTRDATEDDAAAESVSEEGGSATDDSTPGLVTDGSTTAAAEGTAPETADSDVVDSELPESEPARSEASDSEADGSDGPDSDSDSESAEGGSASSDVATDDAVTDRLATDGSVQDDSVEGGPVTDGSTTGGPTKGGPVKRASVKGGARKGSPSPGGPGKGAPRPGGSPKGASAAGGTMTGAPAMREAGQEGDTRGKPEAVGGHERTAAATAPVSAPSSETVRRHGQTATADVTPARAPVTGVTPPPYPATRTAPVPLSTHAVTPTTAPEPSPGTALARPTPSEVARVQQRTAPGATSAAALTPAARPSKPSGHYTVPTAVAVVPASPARRPSVEGGFDFFGTQKGAEALEAVQNEDLADVVGQEALALHKAESEAEFKPASEESRGVGQVIDLTAHDETEQIDVGELRSAVS